jgi:hypothetical protein
MVLSPPRRPRATGGRRSSDRMIGLLVAVCLVSYPLAIPSRSLSASG